MLFEARSVRSPFGAQFNKVKKVSPLVTDRARAAQSQKYATTQHLRRSSISSHDRGGLGLGYRIGSLLCGHDSGRSKHHPRSQLYQISCRMLPRHRHQSGPAHHLLRSNQSWLLAISNHRRCGGASLRQRGLGGQSAEHFWLLSFRSLIRKTGHR